MEENRSAVGIRRFDVRANAGMRFIRRRASRSDDVLSNVLSIHPGGIPPVFSFRFRATEWRKVHDGVLAGREGRTIEKKRESKRGRPCDGANGIGEFAEPACRTSGAGAK